MTRIRISTTILASICLLALPLPTWGQAQRANDLARPGIPVHVFRPTPPDSIESPEAFASIVPTTGTLVFTFTITVKSVLPSTDTIACEATAVVFDTSSTRSFDEVAAVAATGSGTTRTCKVTIPYSWTLASPTTDMVILTYTVSAPGVFFTISNTLPFRFASASLPNMKVPANGATTPIAVNVTI